MIKEIKALLRKHFNFVQNVCLKWRIEKNLKRVKKIDKNKCPKITFINIVFIGSCILYTYSSSMTYMTTYATVD